MQARLWSISRQYGPPFATWEPGPPVPRIATDPTSLFDIEQSDVLIDNFLRGLELEENQFLCSKRELKSIGFVGTGYQYPSE